MVPDRIQQPIKMDEFEYSFGETSYWDAQCNTEKSPLLNRVQLLSIEVFIYL